MQLFSLYCYRSAAIQFQGGRGSSASIGNTSMLRHRCTDNRESFLIARISVLAASSNYARPTNRQFCLCTGSLVRLEPKQPPCEEWSISSLHLQAQEGPALIYLYSKAESAEHRSCGYSTWSTWLRVRLEGRSCCGLGRSTKETACRAVLLNSTAPRTHPGQTR